MKQLRWIIFLSVGTFVLLGMEIMLLETDNNSIYSNRGLLNTFDGDLQRIQQRMEGRMDKIKQVCSNENITKNSFTPQALVSAWYMTEVIEEHGLLMCVVHKAGSSTWNTILAHHYNKYEELIKEDGIYKMISILRPPGEEYIRGIYSPSLFKVFMARNPFERVLSGFRNRIATPGLISVQAKKYVPHVLLYNRGISYLKTDIFHTNGSLKIFPTFSEFVSYLVTRDPGKYDPHWKPVVTQCGVCHVDYDAVLLTETFNEDLRYIMAMTGLDKALDPSLTSQDLRVNKAETDTRQLLASYYSTLTPPVLQKLIEIYLLDFKLFNYDPNEIFRYISSNRTQRGEKVDETRKVHVHNRRK